MNFDLRGDAVMTNCRVRWRWAVALIAAAARDAAGSRVLGKRAEIPVQGRLETVSSARLRSAGKLSRRCSIHGAASVSRVAGLQPNAPVHVVAQGPTSGVGLYPGRCWSPHDVLVIWRQLKGGDLLVDGVVGVADHGNRTSGRGVSRAGSAERGVVMEIRHGCGIRGWVFHICRWLERSAGRVHYDVGAAMRKDFVDGTLASFL